MFTGIIETVGKIVGREQVRSNVQFYIESDSILKELKIDQSVSHNGVCLTVTDITNSFYSVTTVKETLEKTNFSELKIGDFVNLERSMPINGRFDGHIVQGHVDQVGICESVKDENGSWKYNFRYEENENITVEKGSVCVNGVSLTVVDSLPGIFSVVVIPYTFENTNLRFIKPNDKINIEFDIIGKYLTKLIDRTTNKNNNNLTI